MGLNADLSACPSPCACGYTKCGGCGRQHQAEVCFRSALGKRLTALWKLGESWQSQICVDREWMLRNVIIFGDLLIFDN